MAHNINRTNGKDSIVWAGQTPWHRLGTQLPEAFTAAEALRHGGLDYTVTKVGLQTVDGAAVPNRYALRRTDTGAVLGVCAGMYQPLQEWLAMADSLAQQFVKNYPSKRDEQYWRNYFRTFCVPGLRWLWRNGSADTRTTIAARVAVWREREPGEVAQLQCRILARELGRKGVN